MEYEAKKIKNTPTDLPEFSWEVPNEEQIAVIADQVVSNQRQLLLIASDLGLNYDFLKFQQMKFLVGPFVSPAPIPTTFAGDVENFRCSLRTGQQLVQQLNERGVKAEQALVVPIAWTEVITAGVDALDCFILPKNKEENKREFVVGKAQPKRPYLKAVFDPKIIGKVKNSFLIFLERYPELKRRALNTPNIGDMIINDLQAASRNGQMLPYLDFAANYNAQIARRIPSASAPIVNVDMNYYGLFLRRGISDIVRFTRQLDALGLFEDNPGFVKTIIKDRVEILKLEEIQEDDIVLRFGDDYPEPNKTATYSELIAAGRPLTCCKELSYFLCFGNIVPVLYGDRNSYDLTAGGDFYKPYADAIQRLEAIGLIPTMYRIQPKIQDGYQEMPTVFDFYRQLLMEI